MYKSNNRHVLRNKEDWTVRLKSDGPSYPTTVGDVEYFLRRMESDSTAAALYNVQRTLAYERAKFTADCAARNISTAVDAERAWKRIAVAHAEVVSLLLISTHPY